MGRKSKKEGVYVNIELIHFTILQKLTQHCKATMLVFSCPVMSNSLQPHGLQHARVPWPSLSPGVCSNSCPLSWWGHPAISSSDALFSSVLSLSQHQGLFQWVICSDQVTKYWSFSFSINPANEYTGLISLKIDWFDLSVAQGTLRSLLQHHSSMASILWHSIFFMVQLSQLYMTTGATLLQ